jgi:alkyl sulfatase BDS1-like metallo-beta-lactamase superfamily hydrolase
MRLSGWMIPLSLIGSLASAAEQASAPQGASPATITANRQLLGVLDFADTSDFDDALRGRIATFPEGVIRDEKGKVVWDLAGYGFLEAP